MSSVASELVRTMTGSDVRSGSFLSVSSTSNPFRSGKIEIEQHEIHVDIARTQHLLMQEVEGGSTVRKRMKDRLESRRFERLLYQANVAGIVFDEEDGNGVGRGLVGHCVSIETGDGGLRVIAKHVGSVSLFLKTGHRCRTTLPSPSPISSATVRGPRPFDVRSRPFDARLGRYRSTSVPRPAPPTRRDSRVARESRSSR